MDSFLGNWYDTAGGESNRRNETPLALFNSFAAFVKSLPGFKLARFDYPRNPSAFSRKLGTIRSILEAHGIKIETHRSNGITYKSIIKT